MNCETYQQNISRHFDSDLTGREAQDLFLHLAGCDQCRNLLHGMIQLRNAIRPSPAPEPPESLDRKVLSIPAQSSHGHRKVFPHVASLWKQHLAIPVPAAGAALLALLLTTALALTMWLRPAEQLKSANPEVQYIMRLPEVEVRGIPATPAKSVN
jgi:predicted anti-sigma-YlaC factor YlaD